jgi:exodeoxyribonuclease VII small subunit
MTKPTSVSSSDSINAIQLPQGWKYEAAVTEVENIIARIEAGELELEEVFEQFTAAVEYLRQCETFLQQRQQQVDLLIETLSDEPEF